MPLRCFGTTTSSLAREVTGGMHRHRAILLQCGSHRHHAIRTGSRRCQIPSRRAISTIPRPRSARAQQLAYGAEALNIPGHCRILEATRQPDGFLASYPSLIFQTPTGPTFSSPCLSGGPCQPPSSLTRHEVTQIVFSIVEHCHTVGRRVSRRPVVGNDKGW